MWNLGLVQRLHHLQKMKCHYEVLGLPLNAEDEEIKKAYRKNALKWHPDKNRDNAVEATEQFRLVQAAYDVLIDPQERAWYDRHRNEILHKSEFSSFKDGTSDILQYFTPSAYKGFGSDAHSFYSVYGDLFKKISEEDGRFCSEESEEDFVLPDFGDADSSYDEVVHTFYATWQAYSTKLSYVWVEKYDKHEASERRVARLIEKENKKERDKEKKKRNEIVRDLVRFVRKRDPRVQAHKEELEKRAAALAEKTARRRAELLMARVEEAAVYEEQNLKQRQEHEEKISQLEDQLKDEFGFSSENSAQESNSDSEDAEEQLYCPACNKQFKTAKAYKNHERSKKHKEKMTLLRAEMNEELDAEPNSVVSDDEAGDVDVTKRPAKLNKRQKRKMQQKKKLFGDFDSDESVTLVSDPVQNGVSDQKEPDEYVSASPTTNNLPGDVEEKSTPVTKTKKGRRSKKNLHDASSTSELNADPPNFCVTCKSQFPSRNKLFQHLKSTGHSLQLNSNNSKGKKNKKH